MFQIVAALVLAAPEAGPVSSNARVIHVGSVDLDVPVPRGYCLPNSKDLLSIQSVDAADTKNLTHLILVDCRPEKALDNYISVKSPIRGLEDDVERDWLLNGMERQFGRAEFPNQVKELIDQVGNQVSAVTGQTVSIDANFKPRGVDDVCAYMGGNMSVNGLGGAYQMAISGCMTVVGRRVIFLYSARLPKSPNTFASLYKPLREWALSIRPVSKN